MMNEKCIYDNEVDCFEEYGFDCKLCFKERGLNWEER